MSTPQPPSEPLNPPPWTKEANPAPSKAHSRSERLKDWEPYSGAKGGLLHGIAGVALWSWLAVVQDNPWFLIAVALYALVVYLAGYRLHQRRR